MGRPTSKQDLLQAGAEQEEKLWKLINSMTDQEQNTIFSFEDRDKNIRDVLVHLYERHQLLLDRIQNNQKGEEKAFLPEPYNWKTYPDMNVEFWKKHQNTPYEEAEKLLKKSHKKVMKLIDTFSDEELFTKKHFPWTGTTSLGSYCVSATSSHYDWAIKKIKRHIQHIKH